MRCPHMRTNPPGRGRPGCRPARRLPPAVPGTRGREDPEHDGTRAAGGHMALRRWPCRCRPQGDPRPALRRWGSGRGRQVPTLPPIRVPPGARNDASGTNDAMAVTRGPENGMVDDSAGPAPAAAAAGQCPAEERR
jgi:hypothetical protein